MILARPCLRGRHAYDKDTQALNETVHFCRVLRAILAFHLGNPAVYPVCQPFQYCKRASGIFGKG